MLWLCIRLLQTLPEPAGGRLASWALQWSSHVHYRHDAGHDAGDGNPALWIEIGRSLRLFDGLDPLLARIRTALAFLDYSTCLGIAPTPAGAAVLARADSSTPATTLAALRAQLESLPLDCLALPRAVLAACDSAGIRHIGTLLDQPAGAIARRFGPATGRYLQRLVGLAPEPLSAWRAPDHWRARREFDPPVEADTALLFPLQRLLHEFAGYLSATDRAVQRFTLTLGSRNHSPRHLPIGLAVPGRDADQFLQLARERIAGAAPGAAVDALILEADDFTAPVILQTDLLVSKPGAAFELQQLIDRLNARLGAEAVYRLELHADHRPERGWRRASAGDARLAGFACDHGPPRPCWLLPCPQRIAPPTGPLGMAERIESGWWDGADIARDYHLVLGVDGARWWVFRDLREGGWYLAGLWS